jgi:hypothetical protein
MNQTVARWDNRGGKRYVELRKKVNGAYWIYHDIGGVQLGFIDEQAAIKLAEEFALDHPFRLTRTV